MYEHIRKLFRCKDLRVVADLENDMHYRQVAEQVLQMQVSVMKEAAEEQRKLMLQYLEYREQLEEMNRENAYIDGYLLGGSLMQESFGAKE